MTAGYIEKGFAPDSTDIEKINRFTRRDFNAEDFYVFSVALCNNDVDRDYEKFSVQALEELKDKFLGKTGIADHSMKSSDQRARIFDTWVEKVDGRKTIDGEDFYQLKAKAYMVKNQENESFITDIEAGIKKEVSVSCQMGKSVCSICGCDKKLSRCEHINGREYSGRLAFSILSDTKDAYEFSFVAVPAQREAGVTKSFELKKDSEIMTDNDIIKALKDCDENITLSKSQVKEILDKIDTMGEDAQLGREYKKKLTDEVVCLCAKAMPQMDIKTFAGVAQVMTTKELLSFKTAFEKSQKNVVESLQLKPQSKSNNTYSNYKI